MEQSQQLQLHPLFETSTDTVRLCTVSFRYTTLTLDEIRATSKRRKVDTVESDSSGPISQVEMPAHKSKLQWEQFQSDKSVVQEMENNGNYVDRVTNEILSHLLTLYNQSVVSLIDDVNRTFPQYKLDDRQHIFFSGIRGIIESVKGCGVEVEDLNFNAIKRRVAGVSDWGNDMAILIQNLAKYRLFKIGFYMAACGGEIRITTSHEINDPETTYLYEYGLIDNQSKVEGITQDSTDC